MKQGLLISAAAIAAIAGAGGAASANGAGDPAIAFRSRDLCWPDYRPSSHCIKRNLVVQHRDAAIPQAANRAPVSRTPDNAASGSKVSGAGPALVFLALAGFAFAGRRLTPRAQPAARRLKLQRP